MEETVNVALPANRHADQIEYYKTFLEEAAMLPAKLRLKRVVVVGVGGLGSELVRHLGAAGVGEVVCADPDVVRPENLNRQLLFRPEDIGRRKVDVIASRCASMFPETRFESVASFIDTRQALVSLSGPAVDFIACCADEPIGIVEQACVEAACTAGCPVGVTAMNLRRGYWGVMRTRQAQRQASSFFKIAADLAAATGVKPVRGSSSWTNAVIGAFFSEAVVLTLAGVSQPQSLTAFDFESMSAERTVSFDST